MVRRSAASRTSTRRTKPASKRNPKLGWMDRETLISHYPALAQYVFSDKENHRYRVHGLTKSVLGSEPESARALMTRGPRDDWRSSQQDWRVLDRSGMEIGRIIPVHTGGTWQEGDRSPGDSIGESILDGLVRIGNAHRVGFVICETSNAKGRSESRIYVAPHWLELADIVDNRAAALKREVLVGLAFLRGTPETDPIDLLKFGTTVEVLHLLDLLGLRFRNALTGDSDAIIHELRTPMPDAGMQGTLGVVKPSCLAHVCVKKPEMETLAFFLDGNGLPLGRLHVGTWAQTPKGRIEHDDGSLPSETVGEAIERLKHVHGVDISRIRTYVEWTRFVAYEGQPDGPDERHLLGVQVDVRVVPDHAPNIKDWCLTGYVSAEAELIARAMREAEATTADRD